MTDSLPWTCIWNVLAPFWSLSAMGSEAGPRGKSALEVYVEHPNMELLRELVRVMEPDRAVEKALVVGQRGAGKSMDLAWLAHELSETHTVFWVDAVEEGREILQDPIALFVAIALVVYEGGVGQGKYTPDRNLLETFLSACLDTTTQEQVSEQQIKVRLDKVLARLAGMVTQVSWPLALSTANPVFMVTGGVAAGVQILLSWVESSVNEQISLKSTRESVPRADVAARRLTNLVRDVERQLGHPILVVVDGLDRVDVEQVKTLFRRGRDLARPDFRLILTAPLILYATPEFEQIEGFFPRVIITPNVPTRSDEGHQFLYRIIQRRLALCGKTVEQAFEPDALEMMINASGGNVRQFIRLARQSLLSRDGQEPVTTLDAEQAINALKASLVNPLRLEQIQALKDFYHRESGLKIPPGGQLGDTLLRRKLILAYRDARRTLYYALNPLMQIYLEEEGVL